MTPEKVTEQRGKPTSQYDERFIFTEQFSTYRPSLLCSGVNKLAVFDHFVEATVADSSY